MITYRDAYLKKFCGSELETLAYQEVDDLGTFTTSWRDRLATFKVYMLICLENQSNPDDLFSDKYDRYKKEFDGALAKAETVTPDADGNYAPIFSIELERG